MPLIYDDPITTTGDTAIFEHEGGEIDIDVWGTFGGSTVVLKRNTVDSEAANFVPLENGTWTAALGKSLRSNKCKLRFILRS